MSAAFALGTRRIGWIGIGKMGLPICERLAAHWFDVTTLARNPEGREGAIRANLQSEPKISGVVASADILVSAISDAGALLDIVFKAGGLKKTLHASQILVEISTVSPSASRRVAETMSTIGVGYIRSPVSGSTALAAQGALTAVISGPAKAPSLLPYCSTNATWSSTARTRPHSR
jgi:3-hydroxyisobutyrate dehydrogenase-like beta-hydroxyacid dehydrogenase